VAEKSGFTFEEERRVRELFDPELVLDFLFDGVYALDRNRRILYWNAGAERISGYRADEVVGRNCFDDILDHRDTEGNKLCFAEHGCPVVDAMATNTTQERIAYLRRKDGSRVQVLVRVMPLVRNGEVIGAVEVFSDNTQAIRLQEENTRLREQAMLDTLLSIGNRRFLEMALTRSLAAFERYGYSFGVLFIDIDDFKTFNDLYGHEAGDHVLKAFSTTVVNSIRSADAFGRWGGDEFLIVTPSTSLAGLYEFAERLRSMVEATKVSWEGNPLEVTVSIGATDALEGDTIESIVTRADSLMYASKQRGKNTVTVG
jgi:diguanylate cyclase (GGDEF)-like protein/PAS domain S-box-containing protein